MLRSSRHNVLNFRLDVIGVNRVLKYLSDIDRNRTRRRSVRQQYRMSLMPNLILKIGCRSALELRLSETADSAWKVNGSHRDLMLIIPQVLKSKQFGSPLLLTKTSGIVESSVVTVP